MNTISNIRVRSHVLINPWSSWKTHFFNLERETEFVFRAKICIFLTSIWLIDDHPSWNAGRPDCPSRIEIVYMIKHVIKNFNLGINDRLFSFAKSNPLQKPVAENENLGGSVQTDHLISIISSEITALGWNRAHIWLSVDQSSILTILKI